MDMLNQLRRAIRAVAGAVLDLNIFLKIKYY